MSRLRRRGDVGSGHLVGGLLAGALGRVAGRGDTGVAGPVEKPGHSRRTGDGHHGRSHRQATAPAGRGQIDREGFHALSSSMPTLPLTCESGECVVREDVEQPAADDLKEALRPAASGREV